MPVNLDTPEPLLPVNGVKLASVAAGIRYQGRDDLLVMQLDEGSTLAGVYTKNAFCAAPVTLCREHMNSEPTRYLVVNSGNANAGTGQQGMDNAVAVCDMIAQQTGCEREAVLPFSTGVIGEQLPLQPFEASIPKALSSLQEDAWNSAAQAIMTTDTQPKGISRQLEVDGKTVTITGIAKGSGMIRPDMATMLAYVATDAEIGTSLLQQMLSDVTDESFNAITVDGDTSTNDALILMATGASGVLIKKHNSHAFHNALLEVCQYLAQSIIRDAEGATKFVTLDVIDALSKDEAREVAFTVAHSPLVKTALFASDPNWGRILAAVGRASVQNLQVSGISIWLGDTLLIEEGEPAASYTEAAGQAEMDKDEINIRIYLSRGDAIARVWTSDLSHDYVTINADYRS